MTIGTLAVKTRKISKTLSILAAAAFVSFAGAPIAFAQDSGVHLQGTVEQDSHLNPNNQLNHSEIRKDPNADEFAQPEQLDPSQGSFKVDKPAAPPKAPRKPLKATVQDEGQFQGQPATPVMAPNNMGGEPDPRPVVQQPAPPVMSSDPDAGNADLDLAWDMWHKRVAGVIFDRFNFFAKAAFKHSPPLLAALSYKVSADGQIVDMNMNRKSNNVLFNVLVYQSVKSLNGDMSVLQFPQGSRRTWVSKFGTFTQNYQGQDGFKYQTGDKEHVAGGGGPVPGTSIQGTPMQQPMQQMMQRMGMGMPMQQQMPQMQRMPMQGYPQQMPQMQQMPMQGYPQQMQQMPMQQMPMQGFPQMMMPGMQMNPMH